jgi:hypothetical protein
MKDLYNHYYLGEWNNPAPGALGSVNARAEIKALRLALLFAILDDDRDGTIHERHLIPALEILRYCQESAAVIFKTEPTSYYAKQIYNVLRRAAGDGRGHLSRTELSEELGKNVAKAKFDDAIEELVRGAFISEPFFTSNGLSGRSAKKVQAYKLAA